VWTENCKYYYVIRYQALLVAYYKADTKYCCCRATCFVRSHCRLHCTHINRLYTIPSIVGGILQSVLNLIQCVSFKKCITTKPVFNHWQLHVALSRVQSLGSLSVVSKTNKIVNCVYNEIYE
jgi:hypothetical protein